MNEVIFCATVVALHAFAIVAAAVVAQRALDKGRASAR
jgi:hypothetical protein